MKKQLLTEIIEKKEKKLNLQSLLILKMEKAVFLKKINP